MANTTTPREDFSDLLSWLLECGGAELLNVQNGDGMTVLDVASSYGRDASTLRKLAKYGAISSSSIRIGQGLEVMSEEETQRQKIATKEANKREKLLESFTTVREFFYKIEDKLRITVEKEESRRVRIADQEREKFKSILEKGELNLNRVRQRSLNAKRKAAVGVMQKVGRGFLSRTAFRNSAAVLIQRVGRGFKSRTILYSI
ncbi:hypothetical protein AGDE_15986 [Angomonas deanei]|nr:hypothetical protein AGDE_15986 [Angomonas deanei]|eukprot:EPY17977.1 hypothetical protein AGDE_15986 [Angomonas deanei]